MSVSTVANFATAVNAAAPASGNTYSATYTPNFANGESSVTILKNGAAFLTVVYEGATSQFNAANDANLGGITVRWVGADGVQHVSDAQQFINKVLN